jgi:ABC-2 type transport system ATP-binding protein
LTSGLLQVRSLCRRFGELQAVKTLSFDLESGRVYGFIGPNGAGKTTTMRILATLDLPDAGDALIEGLSVLEEPRAVRRRVGFMSDQFTPYPNLSAGQFLDFFARAYGLRGRERIERVASLAGFCGLEGFLGRPASGLSKGMGQRLHLAKTLLHDPALLILDEPTSGLDPRARIEFRELVRELAAHGKSVLISSHILAELAEICDAVIVIERGQRVAFGDIREVGKGLHEHLRVALRVLREGEAAERFLLTQPQVQAVSRHDNRLGFDFTGDEQQLSALVARAAAAGLGLVELTLLESGLEEIFLRTTRGDLQ